MKYRQFNTIHEMTDECVNLLRQHMQARGSTPHAIMLPGGQTPRPVYEAIRHGPFPVSPNLHVMMSDERMVPETSPENNFAQTTGMLSSLGIPSSRIMKVQTGLSCHAAAEQYHSDISAFFERNGRLSLALLGLGSDGHTASIFSRDDIRNAKGRFAIPVIRAVKPDRVSVTPATITMAEKIVFLAVGSEKEKIIGQLKQEPGSVIAGQVVEAAANVELWFSKQGNQ